MAVTHGHWTTDAERNAIATVLTPGPDEPLTGGIIAGLPDDPHLTTAATSSAAPPVAGPRMRLDR